MKSFDKIMDKALELYPDKEKIFKLLESYESKNKIDKNLFFSFVKTTYDSKNQ